MKTGSLLVRRVVLVLAGLALSIGASAVSGTFGASAYADGSCQFARFDGQVNGVVRLCFLGSQGAQIDAKINSPETGLLGLSFGNGTAGFRNREVSSFGPGDVCLGFQQGWLGEAPIAVVLVNSNFNQIDFAPLAEEPPASVEQLRGCLQR